MKKVCYSEHMLGLLRVFALPVMEDNYTYVLADGHEAVCVDPAESEPVLRLLEECRLSLNAVLVTHYHGDHTAGVRDLKQRIGCLTAGPRATGSPWVDDQLVDHRSVEVGHTRIEALATPGHTLEDMCYYEETEGALFSGDTLFGGGCGRVFSGQYDRMWASLCRLAGLPDRVRLFYGHEYTTENLRFALEYEPGNHELRRRLDDLSDSFKKKQAPVPSTMGLEKATNPFLRTSSPEIRVRLDMKSASDAEVFAELRRRKDRY